MTHAGRPERDGGHITGIWCYIAINEGAIITATGTINESN